MGKNKLIYLTVLQVQRHSICMAQLMTWHAVWQMVAYCDMPCCMADGGILCPVLLYGRQWHTVTCHVVWQTVTYLSEQSTSSEVRSKERDIGPTISLEGLPSPSL